MCLSGLKRKRKEKFTLFSDHNGSLLRRQPGACIKVSNAQALGVVTVVNGWQMMMTCSSVAVPFGLWGYKVFPRVFAVPFAFHQALPSILEAILTALAGTGARLPCRR